MGYFVLGVLIPYPCEDPLEYVERAMKPYEGECNKTDGWEVVKLHLSTRGDVTPYAYLALDGSWHERAPELYPEELARQQQLEALTKEHLARYIDSQDALLARRREGVPLAVTDWHREWQRVTREHRYLVAFVWCHG